MSKRLTLPLLLLVAAVVGYVRWQSVMDEPLPPEPVVQSPSADAGAALPCTAQWLTPPGPPAPDDAGYLSTHFVNQWDDQTEPLTAMQLDVVRYVRLEGMVLAKGFRDFFTGPYGDQARETREAIVRIGPPELLAIYDCALTAFPDSKPALTASEREAQLARWSSDVFAPLERHFASLPTSHASDAYIRANAGAGGSPH